MKTSKFEKTIRQKLESISPDFHEDDWTKMQNYMQVHTPPTFWQQYGSWLGYAAAASVTTVMAFLYVNQLSQNNNLVSDVKKLQNQIEVIKTAPQAIQKTDTIYIVQKESINDQSANEESQNFSVPVNEDRNALAGQGNTESEIVQKNVTAIPQSPLKSNENPIIAKNNNSSTSTNQELIQEKPLEKSKNPVIEEKNIAAISTEEAGNHIKGNNIKSANPQSVEERSIRDVSMNQPDKSSGENSTYTAQSNNIRTNSQVNSSSTIPPVQPNFVKTLDGNFGHLAELQAVQLNNNYRKMNFALASRLSSRQAKKVWLAANSSPTKSIVENKKVEKTTQTENVIPKLNLKVPYRFGAGIQFEGQNQVKTVLGEVLVAKKFSVSAGVSWLKIKPMEFFTEKIFRDKNRKDFKRSHPDEVPMAFEILNINVKPTLVQIPLTVAFRNDLNHNFSYYVGAGTNVTVKGREAFSFDCKIPYQKPDQKPFSQAFERKLDIPVINSLNFSAGIEKTWHPVVIQVEGYLYTYFKSLSPESSRTGPGVKLKVLYQIGRKM